MEDRGWSPTAQAISPPSSIFDPLSSFYLSRFDSPQLPAQKLFPEFLESVIPECPLSGIQAGLELDPRLKYSGVTPLG
jgi:hypothetical protein